MSTIVRLDLGDKKEHASRQKCHKSSSTETNYESFSAVNSEISPALGIYASEEKHKVLAFEKNCDNESSHGRLVKARVFK